MDPIRTAVKYSLIPLRTAVQLGELFVAGGEQAPPAEAPPQRRRAHPRRKPATVQASQAPKDLDDVAIARKVESVIFRDDSVEKGKVDVNAADGVVWLRGEAKTPEQIKALERQAAAIPEVRRVENLLHLPKAPAPTRADTPAGQQKTRRTAPRSASTRRPVETAVSGERGGSGS